MSFRAPAPVFRVLLVWFLGLIGVCATGAVPGAPEGSVIVKADGAQVRFDSERAWLTEAPGRPPALHLNGETTVRFDLKGTGLAPGLYRMGLLARTGTRWNDAGGQIGHYRWSLVARAGARGEAADFQVLTEPGFEAVRIAGEPDSWADWYGVVQSAGALSLRGDEWIEITNRENHGGILALWLQPVNALNAARLELRVDAANNAFIAGETPVVYLRAELPRGAPTLDGVLAMEWLDLLTEKRAVARSRIRLREGEVDERTLRPELKPGVYRVRATLEGHDPARPVVNASSAQALFACAPARRSAELPDDWPIGAHVSPTIPPLPGFRWYRYFAQWPEIHVGPGRYEWGNFDAVFAAVRAAGGRLSIASDGSPVWTSARGKAGMAWSEEATAFPPDDWTHLRDYLDTMLARYDDERGTVGELELCNEANTPDRWRGDTAGMLTMARVFGEAVKKSGRPIRKIGLAVSAGDQRAYVSEHVAAGLLDEVDAVSAHFYEELMSPEAATPINNLPRHVAMLREPMRAHGRELPMINTECGIGFAPRAGDRMPTQEELNEQARNDPKFDPSQPWLLGPVWRPVSERRAAATYVAGIVQLMALDVRRSYVFSQLELMIDGAPSLPWVALGRLGEALHGVDHRRIRELKASYEGVAEGDGEPKALAYLIGAPGGRRVIVAWGFLSDTSVGRSKHWQRWLEPRALRVEAGAEAGEVGGGVASDLYGRSEYEVVAKNGALEFLCGEEPVFVVVR